ncbi:MAG: GIY-YIG nuclease family protein [Pirellula sp.]|nr:GIY-YIG nuclease family protein [Pirellula sp.]
MLMELQDLLKPSNLDLHKTLVLRHVPMEPNIRRILPWLVVQRPDLFNAFQQIQNQKVEKQMLKAEHVVSFFGHETNRAVFLGLYRVRDRKSISSSSLNKLAEQKELVSLGMKPADSRPDFVKFDLVETDILSKWKGKLIIDWPPPGIAWSRWADANKFYVDAILEESMLEGKMPDWRELILTWEELQVIPKKLQTKLAEWRGIYFILDEKSGKGYVGSAYGLENIHGRWVNYKKTGHGNNKLLLNCNPSDLRFSILERVSPDMDPKEIISRENSWKERLHTREFGLNIN